MPLYTAKPIGIIDNRTSARSRARCTMPDRPTPTVTGLLAELHAYRVQTMAPAASASQHRPAAAARGDRRPRRVRARPAMSSSRSRCPRCSAAPSTSTSCSRPARWCCCSSGSRAARPATSRSATTSRSCTRRWPSSAPPWSRSARRFPGSSPRSRTATASCSRSLGHRQRARPPLRHHVQPDPEAQARALAKGSDLGAELGTGSGSCRCPTVVVIDADRVVRFADVHPDWLVRTEADVVIDAVRALVQVPA